MTIKESIEQMESLVEAWQLNEADLNQTDINAIKYLLKNIQELIDYLKEQIKSLKNDLKGTKGQERYFLKQILSIYEEILNKIEKR